MNNLSWLLYAADTLGTLKDTAGGLLIGTAFVAVASAVFAPLAFMLLDEADIDPKAVAKTAFRAASILVPVLLVVWIAAPSRQTIMLIAASEVGETVLASPQAQAIGGEAGELATDSLRVLRKFINEQLSEGETK